MIFLSVLAPPLLVRAVGEIFVGYPQPCLRVVSWWFEDIPLVVWGLCFGKVGGFISCLLGPVRGYRRTGPQCLATPSCLSLQYLCCNSFCQGLLSVSYVWSNYPVLSGVLCAFKYAPSISPSPSPSRRT